MCSHGRQYTTPSPLQPAPFLGFPSTRGTLPAVTTLAQDSDSQEGPPLVLASRSPRRRLLLDEAGLPHAAHHPGLEDAELKPGRVTPEQWVAALAYLKAAAWAHHNSDAPASIVLGADTAIVKDTDLIGTPTSVADAAATLHRLSDGSHAVISGVALIESHTGRRTFFVDRASVAVGHLSTHTINEYANSNAWQGKAGGYNLRERQLAGWPLNHSGDPSTVMGLPMNILPARLAAFRAASAPLEIQPETQPTNQPTEV